MSYKIVEWICYCFILEWVIDWIKICWIGIDEFVFKKGYKDFIIIIVDLEIYEIIDIFEYWDKKFLCVYF